MRKLLLAAGLLLSLLCSASAQQIFCCAITVPTWVPSQANLPSIAINWATNQAWTPTGGLTTPDALGVTTTRSTVKWVVDSGGNWSQVPANTTARSDLGRSTEESRTNSIRNNTMVGAVVGTPGSLPTNWVVLAAEALTTNVVGLGTQFGVNYIDLHIVGTPNSTSYVLAFDTGITASSAQIWAESMDAAIVSGSTTNISDIRTNLLYTGGASNNVSMLASLTPTLSAMPPAIATAGGSTTAVSARFALVTTASSPVDITIRFAINQLELGASVSSAMMTSGSTFTRAADVTTLSAVFGSSYSLYEQATPQTPNAYGLNQTTLQVDAGSDSQRALMRRNSAVANLTMATVGGSGSSPSPSGTWTQNSQGKVTSSWSAGAQAGVFNGGTVATDTGASLPTTPTTIRFGSNASGGEFLDGIATMDAIWLRQSLPNYQLPLLP